MKNHIKLMVVEDHEVVRVGLRTLLSNFSHIEIVKEAANAEECLTMAATVNPDIILMDIRLPGMSGIDACREIKQTLPTIAVIMLTSYDSKEFVQEAMQAGANGYILKEIGTEELIRIIHSVMEGKIVFDPSTMNNFVRDLKKIASEEDLRSSLSPVEKKLLEQISHGRTNREIAVAMHLSEKTVRNYVSVILNKLHLHNRTEAAAFYFCQHFGD